MPLLLQMGGGICGSTFRSLSVWMHASQLGSAAVAAPAASAAASVSVSVLSVLLTVVLQLGSLFKCRWSCDDRSNPISESVSAPFPFPFRIAPERLGGAERHGSLPRDSLDPTTIGRHQIGLHTRIEQASINRSGVLACLYLSACGLQIHRSQQFFFLFGFSSSSSSSSRTPTHGAPIDAQHGDGAVATVAAAPTAAPRRASSRHRRHSSRSAAVAVPDAPARTAPSLAVAKLSTRE